MALLCTGMSARNSRLSCISYYWTCRKSTDFTQEDNFTFALDCQRLVLLKIILKLSLRIPFWYFHYLKAWLSRLTGLFWNQCYTTINNTSYIPKSLAENGSIKLSRHNSENPRTIVFNQKWYYFKLWLTGYAWFLLGIPEYEAFYSITAKYLEIAPRTQVLSKKLETIHELFEMLADEPKT